MTSGSSRALALVQRSAAPYLSVLAAALVLGRFIGYLSPQAVLLKGQSPSIVLMFAAFVLAAVMWLMLRNRPRAHGPLLWFLIAMSLAWVVHLSVSVLHGDLFNHTAWLYMPILLMILFKPPRVSEGWVALMALGWATSVALVLTRVLEMLDVIRVMFVPESIIISERGHYWLPLAGILGPDGRWPGPFGHNGTTAMMGALLVVLACARWTKSSPVFLSVGVLTLMLTGGRASIGAAICGIVVVLAFAQRGFMSRVPTWVRIAGALLVASAAAYVLMTADTGATGRQTIWPAFISLWQTSIWVGVGGAGIAASGGVTQEFGHAHNMYLDELARFGILGFVTQFAALGIGVFVLIKAAIRGSAGPLALMAAFAVTALTEPRNDWVHPSVTGFLVILTVAVAGASLAESTAAPAQAKVVADDAPALGALPNR
jgi:hypothetical protein